MFIDILKCFIINAFTEFNDSLFLVNVDDVLVDGCNEAYFYRKPI